MEVQGVGTFLEGGELTGQSDGVSGLSGEAARVRVSPKLGETVVHRADGKCGSAVRGPCLATGRFGRPEEGISVAFGSSDSVLLSYEALPARSVQGQDGDAMTRAAVARNVERDDVGRRIEIEDGIVEGHTRRKEREREDDLANIGGLRGDGRRRNGASDDDGSRSGSVCDDGERRDGTQGYPSRDGSHGPPRNSLGAKASHLGPQTRAHGVAARRRGGRELGEELRGGYVGKRESIARWKAGLTQ